jgi:uncharacterized protein
VSARLRRWLLAIAALLMFRAALVAGAESIPSFDCRKASSPIEETICGNADLARMDRHLTSVWRALVRPYNDERQIAEIRADQNRWLVARNACDRDVRCTHAAYRDRLNRLSGADPAASMAGVFEVARIGAFALYPLGDEYLVSVQTAEPKSGAWTCEVTGRARSDGDVVRVTVGRLIFVARLRNTRTLVVEPGQDVAAVQEGACGMNGTIVFTYKRRLVSQVQSNR